MNNQIFSDKGRAVIRATSRIDKATAVGSAIRFRYMNTKRIINLLAVIITAAVSPVTWAAGHGGSGVVVGGAHVGGFASGVSRAAQLLAVAGSDQRQLSKARILPVEVSAE